MTITGKKMRRAWKEKILRSWLHPLLLVSGLSLFLLLLEWAHPYFFLPEDDNRHFFLPLFVHNYRSILSGELPLYNFHQFLGTPLFSMAQSAGLYPPAYLSVFLSTMLFGHFYATMDILVCMHLILGCLGFFALLKSLNLGGRAAFFGALTWPMCSFIMYWSGSWHFISGAAAYFPWMIYFSLKLYEKPKMGNCAGLVIARLLFFSIEVQMFVYAMILEFLTFLAILAIRNIRHEGKSIKGAAGYYAFSYACTLFLSMPLLLPMWHHMTISADRASPMLYEIFTSANIMPLLWLQGLLYYAFIVGPWFGRAAPNWPEVISLYGSFIGYVSLFFVLGCLALCARKAVRKEVGGLVSVFSGLVLLTFLWSAGVLDRILYLLPIINRFRWHFKVILFTDFYLLILAAFGMYLFLTHVSFTKRGKNAIFAAVMLLQFSVFFYLYFSHPQKHVKLRTEQIPVTESLRKDLAGGRVLSVGHKHEQIPLARGICCNNATLWQLYHFAGYSPILPEYNYRATLGLNNNASYDGPPEDLPLKHFRLWGVSHYVVNILEKKTYEDFFRKNGLVVTREDEYRVIYSDRQAYPLFF